MAVHRIHFDNSIHEVRKFSRRHQLKSYKEGQRCYESAIKFVVCIRSTVFDKALTHLQLTDNAYARANITAETASCVKQHNVRNKRTV